MGSSSETGGLAAALKAVLEPNTRPCRIGRIINEFGEEDAETLRQALADPAITPQAIGKALGALGYALHHATVKKHRDESCCCYVAR